jgi:hypothetical protein
LVVDLAREFEDGCGPKAAVEMFVQEYLRSSLDGREG